MRQVSRHRVADHRAAPSKAASGRRAVPFARSGAPSAEEPPVLAARVSATGIYRGEINFGPDATTVLPEQSSGGAFLAVFDGEGNHVYSVGLACGDTWPKVALDAESSVLLATGYIGTVNLGGDDLPSSGSSNMLVAKFDQDGVHVWSKSFGDAENRETDLFDMAVAPDGDPVITGFFKGSVTFGGATLETAEETDTDGFLVRLNGEDGGHVYSVQIGDRAGDSPGAQYGKGVGVDAMGRAVVAGTFVNSVDFGAGHTRDDPPLTTDIPNVVMARMSP
ncbi:hypothetical protein [Sorangium sp. So ce426]|uniref:hypothetical protein n=1 Tax=Sorangium sp. So ce426 TaxID=3133312 RepID=UPI003F5C4290